MRMRMQGAPLAVALAFAAAALGAGEARPGRDNLQGTWTWAAYEEGGVTAPPEQIKDWTMTIKGDKLLLQGPPPLPKVEATFRLDPSRTPRGIDLTYTDQFPKNRPTLGIYELKGDTLRVCVAGRGSSTRPSQFVATKPSGCGLYVFKRKRI